MITHKREGPTIDSIPQNWEIKENGLKLHCIDGRPIELGRGGHGIVLYGQVHKDDAAVKIIKGSGEEAEMLQEIMILERAKTKYVVRFLGYSLSPDGIVMAMEYAQGGNLYDALRDGEEFQWYNRWVASKLAKTVWPLDFHSFKWSQLAVVAKSILNLDISKIF